MATPEKYEIKPYAFFLQKHSPYLGIFNYYLKEMQEKGALKQIKEKYGSRSQVCPDYSGKPLGFDSCFTAFCALMTGMVIGFATWLFEIQTSGSSMSSWKSYPPVLSMQNVDVKDFQKECIEQQKTIDRLQKQVDYLQSQMPK